MRLHNDRGRSKGAHPPAATMVNSAERSRPEDSTAPVMLWPVGVEGVRVKRRREALSWIHFTSPLPLC